MSAVLMTGFPGFIAGRLVSRLLEDEPKQRTWYFLVLESFVQQAKDQCLAIERDQPGFAGKWHVVTGDITQVNLGMSAKALKQVKAKVDTVWHLAAIYDLSVPQAVAYRVNVDGTVNVLDLCEQMKKLTALNYISTCYVAGARTGRCYEDELDEGQDFKNHYESTKAWAEKHVRHRMTDIPTRIFRPGIVVGDSQTGETAKADGPYFVLNFLMRLPRWLPMVNMGRGEATVNLVPVDFVVDAMAILSTQERALGKTFALADPNPFTARQLMDLFCKALGRAPVVASVPDRLAHRLSKSRRVSRLMRIPNQAFEYFEHEVSFDTTNTSEMLRGHREPCPRFDEVLPNLLTYAKANPQLFSDIRGAQ